MPATNCKSRRRRAFTLVELLVVIGIIALLIAILMPALAGAQRQAMSVKCQAQLNQIGTLLMGYANDNRGHVIPLGVGARSLGGGVPPLERWPMLVFKPPQWNHPLLTCPTDIEPVNEHSYILNNHFKRHGIKYGNSKGANSSDVIVMGEKKSDQPDYHMDLADFERVVEKYRHGLKLGSNYLFLDWHVNTQLPTRAMAGIDPWDPAVPDPDEAQGPVN